MNDVDAEEEHGERPPWVVAAERQQGADRAEAGGGDPNDSSVGCTAHQRDTASQLYQPKDDQHPAERVEVREKVSSVASENSRAIEGAEAIEDIYYARQEQQYGISTLCTT